MRSFLKYTAVFVLLVSVMFLPFIRQALAAPSVLEIRAVCDTSTVDEIQKARARTIPISYWFNVSQAARKNVPGVSFKSGLTATIVISGVTNAEQFANAELAVVDRNNKEMNRTVKVTKASSGTIVLEKVDLGDGIMNIRIRGIAWAIPEVHIHPIGWKGTGVSYNKEKNVFSASYQHRMDNSAIMPEIRVECSS